MLCLMAQVTNFKMVQVIRLAIYYLCQLIKQLANFKK